MFVLKYNLLNCLLSRDKKRKIQKYDSLGRTSLQYHWINEGNHIEKTTRLKSVKGSITFREKKRTINFCHIESYLVLQRN